MNQETSTCIQIYRCNEVGSMSISSLLANCDRRWNCPGNDVTDVMQARIIIKKGCEYLMK